MVIERQASCPATVCPLAKMILGIRGLLPHRLHKVNAVRVQAAGLPLVCQDAIVLEALPEGEIGCGSEARAEHGRCRRLATCYRTFQANISVPWCNSKSIAVENVGRNACQRVASITRRLPFPAQIGILT